MVNHPRRSKRAAVSAPESNHDADWAALLSSVPAALARYAGQPLFATDATGLNDAYLTHLGAERAIHDCYACRRFIENFGALVAITDDGHTIPVFWNAETVPAVYRTSVKTMAKAVAKARVTGVFLSSDKTWGNPTTGAWTHLAVKSPSVYPRRLLTAGQAMAAKREDHHTVARALSDFTPEMLAEAARLLEADHLSRSEKFLGPVHWLAELHAKRGEAKDARLRDNILWRAIATAPDGFCHPRSSVIGPLLENIAAGKPFAEIKAAFEAMLHPLRYQRPQAAPSAMNIAQAEKAVAALGIQPSLERRFARLDEIETIWTPAALKAPERPAGGVFAHLQPKGPKTVQPIDAPAVTMTWEKFARTVLPGAEAIEAYVSGARSNFIALTTAVNADAPPVLKWDHPEKRNPVAWYLYPGGSPASQWGLSIGWAKVNAIAPLPPMWGEKPLPALGEGFVLVLDGAVDSNTGAGNALFPEYLIGDLHGVRATIEAYSRKAELSGREEGSACGLDLRKGAKNIGYRLRVTSCGAKTDYQLDRWD